MKRTIISALVALSVFGVILALAAALDVDGGNIQAGEDDTLACADAANVLGWGYEGDTGKVSFVRIHLDDSGDCEDLGYDMFVHVFDITDTKLKQCSIPLVGAEPGSGWKCNFSAPFPDASAIEKIRIAVEGGAP